jgi:beta-phosphoglucomutase
MHGLASIDVTAGKDPFAKGWLNAPFEQYDTAIQFENGSGNHLGVLVENKRAGSADQALGLVGFDDPLIETSAAARAITELDVSVGVVSMMMIGWHPLILNAHCVETKELFCNRYSMLRAVIFDFNGIIVDDEPIHFELFQKVLAEEGIVLTEETYYARYLGFDDRGAFIASYRDNNRELGQSKLAELIDRKAIYYREAIRNHFAIFPGVKNLIADLAGRVPLAVASGALRTEIETILSTAGLLNYFQGVVSAEDVIQGKPEPEIFLKALARLNASPGNRNWISPAECVVIEDSKEGVKGARRAGMKCLAVTNSHPAALLNEADAVVKSLEEIDLDFLQSMCP